MHLSMLTPRVGRGEGGGATHGKLASKAGTWVGIFDIFLMPQGREFDSRLCLMQKKYPRGRNLTQKCCSREGKTDIWLWKNVKFPWGCPPLHPWSLTLIGALVNVILRVFVFSSFSPFFWKDLQTSNFSSIIHRSTGILQARTAFLLLPWFSVLLAQQKKRRDVSVLHFLVPFVPFVSETCQTFSPV